MGKRRRDKMKGLARDTDNVSVEEDDCQESLKGNEQMDSNINDNGENFIMDLVDSAEDELSHIDNEDSHMEIWSYDSNEDEFSNGYSSMDDNSESDEDSYLLDK